MTLSMSRENIFSCAALRSASTAGSVARRLRRPLCRSSRLPLRAMCPDWLARFLRACRRTYDEQHGLTLQPSLVAML